MRALANGKEVALMDYSYLYDGEIIDTGYGFTNNKGIEVCSEDELDDL